MPLKLFPKEEPPHEVLKNYGKIKLSFALSQYFSGKSVYI